MKQLWVVLCLVLVVFSSCGTKEKILYFQDVQNGGFYPTQKIEPLRLKMGDKISVIITSSSTPELAQRFNLPVVTFQAGTTNASYNNQISVYTVDENGGIDVPTLGRVKVSGLTRSEAGEKIQAMLRSGLLRDAVVTVNSFDQFVTVMGEVSKPGKININKDNLTILEALGQAGDLTIQARRDRVLVLRQEGSETRSYYVDLRSKDLLSSPVYNLQQNDLVYVEPNKIRMGQSTYNENSIRSISTWLSVSSVLISLGILIFN